MRAWRLPRQLLEDAAIPVSDAVPRSAGRSRSDRELHEATREFAAESPRRSWLSLASTFALLGAALAAAALLPSWPLRLAAAVLGALVLVRCFIHYHDFMHGAILPGSRWARAILYAYALVSLAPPRSWRASHNFHHANVGRIEGSDTGSFPLMTTAQWSAASRSRRLGYRLARHPLTILCSYVTVFLANVCLLPLLRSPRRHWDSALALALHGAVLGALWRFGDFELALYPFLLPMAIASAVGGYLFSAQHSFPGMRILPPGEWTHHRAALVSAGYMRLGPVMRWFTGNIGFHHVHHLNPAIPFYSLPRAMAAIPELQHPVVTTLRPRDVVACFRVNLWDEAAGRMVSYRDVPTRG